MAIDNRYDINKTQIQFANETKAFEMDGAKVVGQPLESFRHLYIENIAVGDSSAEKIIETNDKQSYICHLVLRSSDLSYRIEVVHKVGTVSFETSVAGSGKTILYTIVSTAPVYRDIYVPIQSILYIFAINPIQSVFATAERYYCESLERSSPY